MFGRNFLCDNVVCRRLGMMFGKMLVRFCCIMIVGMWIEFYVDFWIVVYDFYDFV